MNSIWNEGAVSILEKMQMKSEFKNYLHKCLAIHLLSVPFIPLFASLGFIGRF